MFGFLASASVSSPGSQMPPVGQTLGRMPNSIVQSDVIHEEILGMQKLERLALNAFTLHLENLDPVPCRTCQLVMPEDAFQQRGLPPRGPVRHKQLRRKVASFEQ
jgi:hypothetical protein